MSVLAIDKKLMEIIEHCHVNIKISENLGKSTLIEIFVLPNEILEDMLSITEPLIST